MWAPRRTCLSSAQRTGLTSFNPTLMRPGRLDQLIYIPMPDHDSHLSILKTVLRKIPNSKEVDLENLAVQMEKFTGADLTKICQRAAKMAIRENVMKDMERDRFRKEAEEAGDAIDGAGEENTVPEILRSV